MIILYSFLNSKCYKYLHDLIDLVKSMNVYLLNNSQTEKSFRSGNFKFYKFPRFN